MTVDEKRTYAREYRAEGFGREADKRYYHRHRDVLLAKQRIRDVKRKLKKLSQESNFVAF